MKAFNLPILVGGVAAIAAALAIGAGAFAAALATDRAAPRGFSDDPAVEWRFIEPSWKTRAKAYIVGSELRIVLADRAERLAYQGVVARRWIDARGGDYSVQMDFSEASQARPVEAKFKLTFDHHKAFLSMQEGGGQLSFVQVAAGLRTEADTPFDPAKDRFWSIRHDQTDDAMVWLTSQDGAHWIERRREPRRLDLSKVRFEIYAGTFEPVRNPGTVVVRGCC